MKEINEIFGVKEISKAPKKAEVLFNAMTVNGTSEQVCCSEDGQYYLTAKAAKDNNDARLGMGTYHVDGQIAIPISLTSAMFWSERNLYGDELAAAISKFGENLSTTLSLVWECGADSSADTPALREWLFKIIGDEFVLYSTDSSYPLCNGSTTFCQFAEDETDQFVADVYVYYIPAETARRWAVAHGIDANTYEKFFGSPAA